MVLTTNKCNSKVTQTVDLIPGKCIFKIGVAHCCAGMVCNACKVTLERVCITSGMKLYTFISAQNGNICTVTKRKCPTLSQISYQYIFCI